MKRFICILCIAACLAGCLVAPVNAENNTLTVYRGSAMVDGVCDSGYLSSANFYLGLDPNYVKINCSNGGESIPAVTRGDCRIMWDDEYLYFYCTAYDTDIRSNDVVGLFIQDCGSVWCLQYYPASGTLVKPSSGSAACFDYSATKVAFKNYASQGYYAVEFALRYYDLKAAREILFHYSVVNTEGSASNESTSGVFFNDRMALNAKAVMSIRTHRAESSLSPFVHVGGKFYGAGALTTVADLRTYYKTDIDVCSPTGKLLSDTDYLPNGCLVYDNGYHDSDYDEIIIHGDVNANGKVESNDYLMLRRALLKLDTTGKFTNGTASFAACDINYNQKIDSNDYLRIRMYVLRTIDSLIPDIPEDLDLYAPPVFSQQQWCGSAQTDNADHILSVVCPESAFCLGGDLSTSFSGYPVNSFDGGNYEDGNRLNISDPMYLKLFENALYDYTYQAIVIAMPKSTSETSKQYLSAIDEMLRLIKVYQPTAYVIFLNVFEESAVYEKAGAAVTEAGGQYLIRIGKSASEVQSKLAEIIQSLPRLLRPSKPAGALPTSSLTDVREGMYWVIHDVEDPCNTQNRKRILLVGDSITFGYYKTVRASLKGEYLVDVVGISYAPSDVNAIMRSLDVVLQAYDYDAIHFNIGIHNSNYDNAGTNYASYLQTILAGIQAKEPDAKLVFATSTPITNSKVANDFNKTFNEYLQNRNGMAKAVCAELGIPVHDLYTEIINNPQPKADTHHYSNQTQLSKWVIAAVRSALS